MFYKLETMKCPICREVGGWTGQETPYGETIYVCTNNKCSNTYYTEREYQESLIKRMNDEYLKKKQDKGGAVS